MPASIHSGRGLLAMPLLFVLASCSTVPAEERFTEIEMYRHAPDCPHEVLGRVDVTDGHDPIFGQSKEWAMTASLEHSEANLRERAADLGADAVVVTQRRLSTNSEGEYSHIELQGLAISECRE